MRELGMVPALFSVALAGCTQESATAQATDQSGDIVGVASVVDGDTIEIHGTSIRLSGFDSPESGKRCGDVNVYQRAANEPDAFIGGRTVSCASTGTDCYGRAVATCSVGGTDLGEHIVSQRWGRDWPCYSHGAYADEEAAARGARRGIWGMQRPTQPRLFARAAGPRPRSMERGR